jgi:hypothetical protein
MRLYREFVLLMATLAVITGAGTLLFGMEFQRVPGVVSGFDDPVLNMQIRHLGAIWFGYGLFLFYCQRQLPERLPMLNAALAILVLAALGRAAALIEFGFPGSLTGKLMVVLPLVIGLVITPLAILWSQRNLGGEPTTDDGTTNR